MRPKRVTFLKEKFEKVALFCARNKIFVTKQRERNCNSYIFELIRKMRSEYTKNIRQGDWKIWMNNIMTLRDELQ